MQATVPETSMNITDRILIELDISSNGAPINTTITTYFENDYYSYIQTSLNDGTNILSAYNTWTGNNDFSVSPSVPTIISNVDSSYPVNVTYLNTRLTNLTSTNFSTVNLSATNISTNMLSTVNLSATNISTNMLSTVNLSATNISTRNLSTVNLSATNISTFNLSATNISTNNIVSSTTAADCNLFNNATTQTIKIGNGQTTGDFYIGSSTGVADAGSLILGSDYTNVYLGHYSPNVNIGQGGSGTAIKNITIGNAYSTININAPLLPQYAYNATTGITPTTGIGYINSAIRGGNVNFSTVLTVLSVAITDPGVYLINVRLDITNMNAFAYTVPTILSTLGFGASNGTGTNITSHYMMNNAFGASGGGAAVMSINYSTVEPITSVTSPNNFLYVTILETITTFNLRCNAGSYLLATRIA
jgi:hypothetical protein